MSFLVRIVYWPVRLFFRVLVALIMKVEVVGLERVPERGALIVASNHLNNADPPVLGTSFPRRLVFMAKQEAMGWPIIGAIIRLSGAFPVKRFEADLGALRRASQVTREGQVLAMFPEGTRSRTATLGPGHPGTALVALRTGTPILPVAISGTEQIHFPKVLFRALRLDRPRVRIEFGDPFFLPSVSRVTAEEVRDCTNVIMRRIAAMLPPAYRGVYGEPEPPPEVSAGQDQ